MKGIKANINVVNAKNKALGIPIIKYPIKIINARDNATVACPII